MSVSRSTIQVTLAFRLVAFKSCVRIEKNYNSHLTLSFSFIHHINVQKKSYFFRRHHHRFYFILFFALVRRKRQAINNKKITKMLSYAYGGDERVHRTYIVRLRYTLHTQYLWTTSMCIRETIYLRWHTSDSECRSPKGIAAACTKQ